MPETSTCGPTLAPWLQGGELGAFAVVMIWRGMMVLPVPARINAPLQDRGFRFPASSFAVRDAGSIAGHLQSAGCRACFAGR